MPFLNIHKHLFVLFALIIKIPTNEVAFNLAQKVLLEVVDFDETFVLKAGLQVELLVLGCHHILRPYLQHPLDGECECDFVAEDNLSHADRIPILVFKNCDLGFLLLVFLLLGPLYVLCIDLKLVATDTPLLDTIICGERLV